MDRLWSPWRLAYVTSASGGPSGCIFCDIFEPGREELVLVRGRDCCVVLNLFPYNNGHLMVVPSRHVATLEADDHQRACRADAIRPPVRDGADRGISRRASTSA